MANEIIRGGTQDPTNGVPVSGAPVLGNGTGKIQNIALLQNKTAVTPVPSRTVASSAVDAYTALDQIPDNKVLPIYNHSYLAMWMTMNSVNGLVNGYIALFDENKLPMPVKIDFSMRSVGIKLSASPLAYVCAWSGGDVDPLSLWVGPAAWYSPVITDMLDGVTSMTIYTRPYN